MRQRPCSSSAKFTPRFKEQQVRSAWPTDFPLLGGKGVINMDMKDVAKMAKAIMLEHGSHYPMVLVEGTQGGFCALLKEFPAEHEAKVLEMARDGLYFGQHQGRIGRLEQVFFISEGWMSLAGEGRMPEARPSEDPNRKEVLLVTALGVEKLDLELVILEVGRDGEGKVVELREMGEGMEGARAESDLLPAFVAGFRAGSRARAEC